MRNAELQLRADLQQRSGGLPVSSRTQQTSWRLRQQVREQPAAGRDVCSLLMTFSHLLSERVVADTSQISELEGVLAEAATVASCLREKKKYLRQTLSVISEKLQD
ncbi:testis-expressed protein 12 isoform X3 [Brachionichthys hirsutus]|uniref:testis-expressed protein 12 isoform X3 n=1 Tax=Brachionichthys hirsutus TaxID=412623 RepID=UPI003604AF76